MATTCGTVRRLQALIRRGFTPDQLASVGGVRPTHIVRGAWAYPGESPTLDATADALYDKLQFDDPPENTPRCQIHDDAENGGWLPPEAWTECDIDNPYHFPPDAPPLTEEDEAAIARALGEGKFDLANTMIAGHELEIPRLMTMMSDAGMSMSVVGQLGNTNGANPIGRAQYRIYRYRGTLTRFQEVRQSKYAWHPTAGESARRSGDAVIVATASRTLTDNHLLAIWRLMAEVTGGPGRHTLFEGGGRGGDMIIHRLAASIFGLEVVTAPADWYGPCQYSGPIRCPTRAHRQARSRGERTYCPAAGLRRNQLMVDRAAALASETGREARCLAVFHRRYTEGALDCRRRAERAGMVATQAVLERVDSGKRRRAEAAAARGN